MLTENPGTILPYVIGKSTCINFCAETISPVLYRLLKESTLPKIIFQIYFQKLWVKSFLYGHSYIFLKLNCLGLTLDVAINPHFTLTLANPWKGQLCVFWSSVFMSTIWCWQDFTALNFLILFPGLTRISSSWLDISLIFSGRLPGELSVPSLC